MCDEIENNYEAPRISWEWNPGDVGEFGDGVLVITATGDGFVMLEADERTRTGVDEAVLNMKAEYGQTIIAEAYIARAGEPVSPTTRVTIKVPDREQEPEPACEAPHISWEWSPGDFGEFSDGILVITATGNGFVMLEAGGCFRTGEDEAVLNLIAKYGQTIIVEAYIAKAGEPVSPTTKFAIEVPDEEREPEPARKAPSISWEWNPGDVGRFGDGILIITAMGDGFVRLDADGHTSTGEDEAVMNIKAEYGQTIIAEAYIAKAGEPVSPTTKVTIVVPNKAQEPDPTTPPSDDQNGAPVLIFGDESGNPIKEIALAPGEKRKVQIILKHHPDLLTQAIQAQWFMYDAQRNLTANVICKKLHSTTNWFSPLNLSTNDEDKGGMIGNIVNSAEYDTGIWRFIGANTSTNQFWYPRGEFTTPIAVAQFTIQAPSDWTDKYATFELDTDYTLFITASDNAITPRTHYRKKCDYNMVLTIRNKNQ